MLRHTLTHLFLSGLACAAAATGLERGWPQFRGPDRNGLSPETEVLRAWPEDGPRELWRHAIGPAFSGIAVADDRLYTTESDADGDYVVQLDADSGRTLWRSRIGPAFAESFGNGPRTTPALDGDRLYALSGDGHLAALSTDGARLWSVDLKERFGVAVPEWGFSSAPLVAGAYLIVNVGAPDGEAADADSPRRAQAVVAFDKSSGDVVWTAGEGEAAYSSPMPAEIAGRRQIVLVHKPGLLGVSLDGEVLWTHEWADFEEIKPALPIFVEPDLVFASASYGQGAVAVRVTARDGAFRAEEVWRSTVMRNHFNSSVLVDGKVYGFDNATLKCVDPATGEELWARRGGLGKGSLIYADGLLLVLTETGELRLVEATPETYTELASHNVLNGRSWTEPTLVKGRLYLRNKEEIVALDLKQAPLPASAADSADGGADRRATQVRGLDLGQILARHREARGGEEKLQAIDALRFTGVFEESGIERPFTLTRKHSDFYRFESEAVVQVYDGETVRSFDPESGRPNVPEEHLAALLAEDYGRLRGPLVEAGNERLELVGETELDGTPVYHLRSHLPSGRTQDWYLAQDTFLLLKRSVAAHSPYFGEYTRDYWYLQYQEHEGVLVPTLIERNDDPFVTTFKIESVEIGPDLEESLFEEP